MSQQRPPVENAGISQRRLVFFLAALIVSAMAAVSFFFGTVRELGVLMIGIASGALLWHLLIKWTLATRTTEAFQDVREILGDSMKKTGRLGAPDPDYVLANGIVHGLRYLNLADNPNYADSEFQVLCREIEKKSEPNLEKEAGSKDT